ncbi:hypothetical protein ACFWAR_08735 [Streptomyces sp. NPDC059917]|uniref:hypothetical protein n=1 Tax=Streptomyces sp. NPDC059917 TaxID=3347002 RepID=UPI00364EA738
MSHHAPRTSWTAARRQVLAGGGAVLALALATACGPVEEAGQKSPSAPAAQQGAKSDAPKKDEPKKDEAKKVAIKGDGTVQVGKDAQPGTYRTTGNAASRCYWERLKDTKGEMDSIIANDNVTGSSYVTLAAGEYFKSSGCKGWEAVPKDATGTPKAEIAGDGGMLRVGSDIAPGTYKSEGRAKGSSNCYWERTKDAEHGLDSIAANDNPTGSAIVTIDADDAYFKSSGCADWKKS